MSRLGPSAHAQRIAEDLDARDAAIRAAHEAGFQSPRERGKRFGRAWEIHQKERGR